MARAILIIRTLATLRHALALVHLEALPQRRPRQRLHQQLQCRAAHLATQPGVGVAARGLVSGRDTAQAPLAHRTMTARMS